MCIRDRVSFVFQNIFHHAFWLLCHFLKVIHLENSLNNILPVSYTHLISACIPAPPELSDPAIVNALNNLLIFFTPSKKEKAYTMTAHLTDCTKVSPHG